MVAGGAGDHAAVRFFLGQGADLVVSAAQLERAGQLQVLRLNIDILAVFGAASRGVFLAIPFSAFCASWIISSVSISISPFLVSFYT